MQSTESEAKESAKQKLTLGIDRNVIEKAKAAGINISAMTENVLRTITYQRNEGNTLADVVRAYQALFEIAQSKMSEYNGYELQICVGEDDSRKVYLDGGYGLLFWDHKNNIHDQTSVADVLHILYDATKILENLFVALTELAEENKEKISKLKFALRLVKALSDDEGELEN